MQRGVVPTWPQQEELVSALLGVLIAGTLHLLQMDTIQLEFLWHRKISQLTDVFSLTPILILIVFSCLCASSLNHKCVRIASV